MKPNLIPVLLLAVLSLFFSCQRTPDILISRISDSLGFPSSSSPDQLVVTSITGKVLDETGNPVNGAEVKAGDVSTTTDEYGVFRFTDVMVSQQFTFVKVSQPGYFPGSRTLLSRKDGNSFITIKLIPKKLTSTFNASSGTTIDIKSSSTIIFPPDAIVTASGIGYNGEVRVYTSIIDPTAEDFNQIMPGDLRGINSDSQVVALKSYGMVNVHLESPGGEPLQLAAGKPAVIKYQVSPSLVSKAPAQIPLWHFSETDGKWREEGNATLINGAYTGNVSHFSTWNFDDPLEFVFISIKVQQSDSVALSYQRLKISDPVTGKVAEGLTDSTGSLIMWAPKNVSLEIELFNECGDLLYSKMHEPLVADENLGTITVTGLEMTTVKGTVIDCRLQPVSGKVILQYQGLNHMAKITDGQFEVFLNKCNSSLKALMIAIDEEGSNNSGWKDVELTGTAVNTGPIEVCGNNAEEYALIKMDNDSVLLIPPVDLLSFEPQSEGISMTFMDDLPVNLHQYAIEVRLVHDSVITYQSESMYTTITFKNEIYYPKGLLQYEIKEYGAVGEDIFYTVSGDMVHYKETDDIRHLYARVRCKRIF